jgi:L-lactate dehydrogenase (cytochrome)
MIDSGCRRGADVLKALVLGARFVFVARAALYGLATAGEKGAAHALGLLQREIDINLALPGCSETAMLSRDSIRMRAS